MAGLAVLYLLLQTRPAVEDGPYHMAMVGRVPVSAHGRVKPLDTVARNSLMIISDRQTFRHNGQRQLAIHWLVDVIARPEQAAQYEVFRIDHPEVLTLIGATHDDGKRFSFAKIRQHAQAITQQAQQASAIKPKQRNAYQKHVLELYQHIGLYLKLSRLETPYLIPPVQKDRSWQPFADGLREYEQTGRAHPAVVSISRMMSAYQSQLHDAFNRETERYHMWLSRHLPAVMHRANYEVYFNRFQPFYHAIVLYVVAFLIACVSFMARCSGPTAWAHTLGRAALWLTIVTFLVHTFGLGSRIYLQGRPPVTNLYSSAVFIGWGCVALALVLERMYRSGLGNITAALVGFTTLIVAHNLAGDGDTMEMMQAVLDSNFWLATHVVAVTIGYSSTFLAGFLAILFILLGVFTRAMTRDMTKQLGQMVYGVLCFALVFSFVGTVLGGIWADQSWGRFWGWDPKENGAVLIVLMNALILHARWGGMISHRGIMVLAVLGNIITSWSWFGTNMLGVGLHSYGFIESAVFWMLLFVASQLAIIGIGLIPIRFWRSSLLSRQPAP